jgi:hypothetical protein
VGPSGITAAGSPALWRADSAGAVYVAIGIDCDGARQVLGFRIGPTTGESAVFWLFVLSELKGAAGADSGGHLRAGQDEVSVR